jgi:cell division protein ZapA (FtsZ GTPase activity inhibitor)
MDELSISLTIAGRPYKLVIEKEHEELFRKSAKLIEKRMKDYSGSYAYKDNQDLLAMVALEFATRYLREEQDISQKEVRWEQKLAEIDATLDTYLH